MNRAAWKGWFCTSPRRLFSFFSLLIGPLAQAFVYRFLNIPRCISLLGNYRAGCRGSFAQRTSEAKPLPLAVKVMGDPFRRNGMAPWPKLQNLDRQSTKESRGRGAALPQQIAAPRPPAVFNLLSRMAFLFI